MVALTIFLAFVFLNYSERATNIILVGDLSLEVYGGLLI